jgi:hypothetical protein
MKQELGRAPSIGRTSPTAACGASPIGNAAGSYAERRSAELLEESNVNVVSRRRSAASVRTPVSERQAVGRSVVEARSRRRWHIPRGLRKFLISNLLLVALLLLLSECQKPTSLTESALLGPRLATGPVCIDEAVDVSGSMTSFTPQRQLAEAALFDLARRQLDPSDSIAVAFFTGAAAIGLPPTPLEDVTVPPTAPAEAFADGTTLAPAVHALGRSRAAAGPVCAAKALVVVTDGLIADPEETAAALSSASYTRVFAVVPAATGWGRPSELDGLAPITVYHFTELDPSGRVASVFADAKPLDVVLGEIVGSLTGQELTQITVPTP